jgi:serine/threonine protein kinase
MSAGLTQDVSNRITYKAAHCCEHLGHFEDAVKYFKQVMTSDPSFHDVEARLRTVREKLRNAEQIVDKPVSAPVEQVKPQAQEIKPGAGARRAAPRARVNSIVVGTTEIPIMGNDRYRIIEEIAHGGMGVVYKASDTILGRTVVLKVLGQKFKDNSVALGYFMREARASAQLQHVNIITIFDIGSFSDGTVYLAMELVDGKTLKQLVAQTGPFQTKFLVRLAVQACRGLQYAHDSGIVHRDIKSGNIMLAKKDMTLKILDLGLAKLLNDNELGSTQAIGTPYYMSPEQVLGSEIDCRSDIYSLGVTLYELSTGTLPFLKGDLPYKHVHEIPPPPSSINPKVHPGLEEIILKMLNKKPVDRFASCKDVVASLKKLGSEVA